MTERAHYTFRVKESANGTPWIMLEPVNGEIPALTNIMIGFDLPPNTSFDRAKAIAKFLDENLAEFNYTKLPA